MGRAWFALGLAVAALGALLFGGLSHPLLWQDEGETAMFAQRVLEYGYPKVHGDRNVVNEFGSHAAAGVREDVDAYIGKTWGDFYLAAPALWWARRVDDPYAMTGRLRLPFAGVGAAGVAVWGWAIGPFLGGARSRRLFALAAFVALCTASISLLLHLREVRYYGLLVLLLGGTLGVHLRRRELASRWSAAAVEALLLVALFHVFYPAWLTATALLGLERCTAFARSAEPLAIRARSWVGDVAPLGVAALLVAPALVFFETFSVASSFSRDVGWSVAGYLANLAQVAAHLARHELLLPALLARTAVAVAARLETGGGQGAAVRRRVATSLAGFALGYVLLGCLNPLVYERYFVVLSPLLVALFVLDATTLLEIAPARRGLALAVGIVALASVGVRGPEIGGRLAELREPVRGPVDHVVAHVRERHPDPKSLVIATSYEAHPLMLYLGSRVIVGLSLHNIANERDLSPDLLVPRGGWPRGLVELRRFASRDRYEPLELEVRDVHFNNVPSLSRTGAMPDVHRFRTAPLGPGEPRLRVYWRSGSDSPVGDDGS